MPNNSIKPHQLPNLFIRFLNIVTDHRILLKPKAQLKQVMNIKQSKEQIFAKSYH